MRRRNGRWLGQALTVMLLLPTLHAAGLTDGLLAPALGAVETLVAGDAAAILSDPRAAADRRLARKARELARRSGERAPEVDHLVRHVAIARQAALRHRVPVGVVLAVIHNESRFAEDAISPVGAVGLMQLMPHVARSLASSEGLRVPRWLEMFDAETNIELGVILLRRLHDRYGSWERALAHYNGGHRAFVEGGIRADVLSYVRKVERAARLIGPDPALAASTT